MLSITASPVRSWRSALGVVCLVGAATAGGVLTLDLRDASRALGAAGVQVGGRSLYPLYLVVAALGAILLTVSLVAFCDAVSRRESERERAIRDLTTGLRHELNNALASILLEAQLLAEAPSVPDDACVTGATIAEQAERMCAALRRLDHVEQLPVVNYLKDRSMVDFAPQGAVVTGKSLHVNGGYRLNGG